MTSATTVISWLNRMSLYVDDALEADAIFRDLNRVSSTRPGYCLTGAFNFVDVAFVDFDFFA